VTKIKATEEEHTQLDWAFTIIFKFMMKNDLAILRSKSLPLVVTYLGDE
jgi:hypothetical protein